jgi:hypothetical protein
LDSREGEAFDGSPQRGTTNGCARQGVGELEAVTLRSGERLAISFLVVFVFLGALPCTDWLADVVARDRNGLILTGTNAGGESLLETSSPTTHASIAERDHIEVGLNRRVATRPATSPAS